MDPQSDIIRAMRDLRTLSPKLAVSIKSLLSGNPAEEDAESMEQPVGMEDTKKTKPSRPTPTKHE